MILRLLLPLLLPETYLGPCQNSMMKLFGRTDKTAKYFQRKAPSYMFDKILYTSLIRFLIHLLNTSNSSSSSTATSQLLLLLPLLHKNLFDVCALFPQHQKGNQYEMKNIIMS